jgi:hypothetical protein
LTHPSFPAPYIDAFLAVCLEPGKGSSGYAPDIHAAQPTASRVLLEIGPKARERSEGLGLVDKSLSPTDYRTHEYFLTPKGRQLMQELIRTLKEAG